MKARHTPDQLNGSARLRLPERACPLPSGAIHELRTPLTSIHGYAQILQRSLADNPKAANALSVIVRESGRLTQMLAELSDVVELETPASEPARAPVDVREIVEASVAVVRRQRQADHQISVDGSGTVVGDARRLSQAIYHVLENAVCYSEPDCPVVVTIADAVDRVRISVADEGIGIAADDADRIYQPFVRGTNARQLGGRGLGLGLCIAQEALALEGGTVRHVGRPGGGTVFIVELPRS